MFMSPPPSSQHRRPLHAGVCSVLLLASLAPAAAPTAAALKLALSGNGASRAVCGGTDDVADAEAQQEERGGAACATTQQPEETVPLRVQRMAADGLLWAGPELTRAVNVPLGTRIGDLAGHLRAGEESASAAPMAVDFFAPGAGATDGDDGDRLGDDVRIDADLAAAGLFACARRVGAVAEDTPVLDTLAPALAKLGVRPGGRVAVKLQFHGVSEHAAVQTRADGRPNVPEPLQFVFSSGKVADDADDDDDDEDGYQFGDYFKVELERKEGDRSLISLEPPTSAAHPRVVAGLSPEAWGANLATKGVRSWGDLVRLRLGSPHSTSWYTRPWVQWQQENRRAEGAAADAAPGEAAAPALAWETAAATVVSWGE